MASHGIRSSGVLQGLIVAIVAVVLFLIALLPTILPVPWSERRFGISPKPHELSKSVEKEPPRDIGPAAGEASEGVPVFCYHYLRSGTGVVRFLKITAALFLNLPLLGEMEMWTQNSSTFERQMKHLRDNGYETVDLDDLVQWRLGLRRLPPKPVVITFDDGDRSVYELAYPILKKYGFKAVFFVVTGKVGENWQGVESVGWRELGILQDSGVFTIESHTHELHYKVRTREGPMPVFLAASRGLYEMHPQKQWKHIVLDDLAKSRESISSRLGSESRYLAWPYGFADENLDSLAFAAGFRGMCTLESGIVRRFPIGKGVSPPAVAVTGTPVGGSPDPQLVTDAYLAQVFTPPEQNSWKRLELKRYTITSRTTMRIFKKMLAGEVFSGSYSY